MTVLFADTFYWIAVLNRGDAYHTAAISYPIDQSVHLLTTAWVMTETADALRQFPCASRVAPFFRRLKIEPAVQIVAHRRAYLIAASICLSSGPIKRGL